MKIVAVAVLLALLILPFTIRFFYIIAGLLTKGSKWIDLAFKPSPKLESFRLRKKWLFSTIIAIYVVIFFTALCWALYELIGDAIIADLNIPLRQSLFIMVTLIIVFTGYIILLIYLRKRVFPVSKKYPRPDVVPSSPEFIQWKKQVEAESLKQSNYVVDHLWHYVSRYLLLVLGLIIMGVAMGIIVAFVH